MCVCCFFFRWFAHKVQLLGCESWIKMNFHHALLLYLYAVAINKFIAWFHLHVCCFFACAVHKCGIFVLWLLLLLVFLSLHFNFAQEEWNGKAVSKETFYFHGVVFSCNAIRFRIDLETIKWCRLLLRFFCPFLSIISLFLFRSISSIRLYLNLHLIKFNCFAIVF